MKHFAKIFASICLALTVSSCGGGVDEDAFEEANQIEEGQAYSSEDFDIETTVSGALAYCASTSSPLCAGKPLESRCYVGRSAGRCRYAPSCICVAPAK